MRTLLLILVLTITSCKTNHNVSQDSKESDPVFKPLYNPGPHALVYKTKANYNNLVPVILSEDKSAIVSYPHPSDIKIGKDYQYPIQLNKGYLLDNRGINANVAFLKMTYEEYGKLKVLPSPIDMYQMIIDKEPLTELCDCGNRNVFTNITGQINTLIYDNKLRTTCKKIK